MVTLRDDHATRAMPPGRDDHATRARGEWRTWSPFGMTMPPGVPANVSQTRPTPGANPAAAKEW